MDLEWERHSSGLLCHCVEMNLIESEGKPIALMRQMNFRGDQMVTLEELYAVAQNVLVIFAQQLEELIQETTLPPSCLYLPPLKSKLRTVEKAQNEYSQRPGSLSWVYDIVRGTIICNTENEINEVLSFLLSKRRSNATLEVVRIKNRFLRATPGGYRDLLINLRVTLPPQENLASDTLDENIILDNIHHICELQIHHRGLRELDLRLGSHSLYEYFRVFFRGNTDAIEKRLLLLHKVLRVTSMDRRGPVTGTVVESTSTSTSLLGRIVHEVIERGDSLEVESMLELLDFMAEYEHILEIRTHLLRMAADEHGCSHSRTLDPLNNLANVVCKMGDYATARSLYKKVLIGYERALGPHHPSTLNALNNLAIVFYALGDHSESKPLYERVVKGYENIFGQDHPTTLNSLLGLANVISSLNDFSTAKAVFERVLYRFENAFGIDHPNTLLSLSGLANVFFEMGDYSHAQNLYEQALIGYERLFGPDHPNTLSLVNELAIVYYMNGDYSTSSAFYQRANTGYRKSLPFNHPTILSLEIFSQMLEMEEIRPIASAPESVLVPRHPHLLHKIPRVYKGFYKCDICCNRGFGWVYHCELCCFDVHPLCAALP